MKTSSSFIYIEYKGKACKQLKRKSQKKVDRVLN